MMVMPVARERLERHWVRIALQMTMRPGTMVVVRADDPGYLKVAQTIHAHHRVLFNTLSDGARLALTSLAVGGDDDSRAIFSEHIMSYAGMADLIQSCPELEELVNRVRDGAEDELVPTLQILRDLPTVFAESTR
jgi:hypothetical protein